MRYIFIQLLLFSLFLTGCVRNNEVQINSPKVSAETPEKKESSIKTDIIEKKDEILKDNKEEKTEENKSVEEKKVEPKVIIKEKTKIVVVEKPISSDSKIIVGSNEYVYVPSLKLTYKAKIDTGATTTSIHALDIKEFERDGKKWVKFKLDDTKGGLIEKSLPVERVVNIKRHKEESQKRYVVKMRINLGKTSEVVEVSLTDRSQFNFPVLIGKNYLNGYVIVDVSKKYLTKPKKTDK